MKITIDAHSGFCFGVVYAIQMAEDELDESGKLYCLGDIVHNNMEVDRQVPLMHLTRAHSEHERVEPRDHQSLDVMGVAEL